MRVSVPNKALLVPANPAHASFLPFPEYQGTRVVPHRIDETILLRNLGYDAPSPIEYYYDWPGQFTPMEHQVATSSFLTVHRRGFVLNGIGTGKTLSALWAADYLMRESSLRRVLVVSPLSTLSRVWGDAIFSNLTHRRFTILHGTKQTRQRLFAHPFDFYIVNFDGIEAISLTTKKKGEKAFSKFLRDDIDLVIIDEGAAYRNNTQRWKLMKRLLQPHQWVWHMTATPTPNSPTDAYGQIKLVNPSRVVDRFPSFRSFELATMDQKHMYKWVPKSNAMDTVYSVMQPAIRYARDDCLDLPECVYETRDVELTPEQTKAYKEMHRDLVTRIKGGTVTALNAGVQMMRLVQIASGVAYDRTGEHLEIEAAPRFTVLDEIIEEAGTKVIVFVPFTGNLAPLATRIGKRWSHAVVYGGTSKNQRDQIFRDFQQSRDPRVLIAHPGCMSHGLTLTEASTIVWWAPITSNETYDQANGRINRIGQKNNMLVMHLAGTAVERRIYKSLETKQRLQNALLDMVAEATE